MPIMGAQLTESMSWEIIAIDPRGRRENCVQQHEAAGFVQADNLTPEQRANLKTSPQTLTIERR